MEKKIIIILLSVLFTGLQLLHPCTNILVSRGAAKDGSTMISYAADSHVLLGELYHWPGKKWPEDAKLKVFEWDTGKFLGKIDQVDRTYNVIGNINEHQVALGETTFGGRRELRNRKGVVDYGSAMYIALQRSKTAREAIRIMADLFERYGYYSSGESFSISDPREVWIMEVIGKGEGVKGANWVALRIPDGYICAHANQSRIRKFPKNNPERCLYSKGIVEFARSRGYFKGKDSDFSFADAFSPPGFGGLRFCEARVWSVFRRSAPSKNLPIDYVKGVEGAEPLPLFFKPDKKLSVSDVFALMRDHFEGTEFDMTIDVGAGPFKLPYRWRGLTWKYGNKTYFNERAISTQQTGFSFITQSRSWLPDKIGGILWFGVDDTFSTCYFPVYCSSQKAPYSFAVGTGSFDKFSWDSAFWVFNFVSNFAYLRYNDIIKDIQILQRELESGFMSEVKKIDKVALAKYKKEPQDAVDYLTSYTSKAGEMVTEKWKDLGMMLFVKYLDGNVRNENGKVTHPGYPEEWYETIVKETGRRYKYKKMKAELDRDYKKEISAGVKELNLMNFRKSLNHFKAALKIRKSEKFPAVMIKKIQHLMDKYKVMIKEI